MLLHDALLSFSVILLDLILNSIIIKSTKRLEIMSGKRTVIAV